MTDRPIPKFVPEPLLSVEDFAKAANVKPRNIYGLIQRRVIRSVKIGRLIRIPESEARRLLTVAAE
jgi:excisionase family DNA binding protein